MESGKGTEKDSEGNVSDTKPVRIGISSCLLGEKVRYDGGHRLDRYLRDTLGQYVDYFPVCPEVECGLGVPREAMHLAGDPQSPRLVTTRTGVDLTDRMKSWAASRVRELAAEGLSGFIFKSRSPSCGIKSVNLIQKNGQCVTPGVGIFARMFMENFPRVPVEDEGTLRDPGVRDDFSEAIFTNREDLKFEISNFKRIQDPPSFAKTSEDKKSKIQK